MQRAVEDELSDESDESNDSDDSVDSEAEQVPCAQMKVVRVRRLGSLPAQLTSLSPQVSPQSHPAAMHAWQHCSTSCW